MSCDVKFAGGNKFDEDIVGLFQIFCTGFGGLLPSNCFLEVIYLVTPKKHN